MQNDSKMKNLKKKMIQMKVCRMQKKKKTTITLHLSYMLSFVRLHIKTATITVAIFELGWDSDVTSMGYITDCFH